MSSRIPSITVTGIDVGGSKKGFHAVCLKGGHYAEQFATTTAAEMVNWCRNATKATVIAIDAPCRWSTDGGARPAERQMMKKRIWCFSTPSEDDAREREALWARDLATNHYGWMLRGADLFQELEGTHPLCTNIPNRHTKCCFETFPHAVTWHLRGGNADASRKRKQRQALLTNAKIDLTELTNIDLIDAALCALTAWHVAIGRACVRFGEPSTGVIIVPAKTSR